MASPQVLEQEAISARVLADIPTYISSVNPEFETGPRGRSDRCISWWLPLQAVIEGQKISLSPACHGLALYFR